MGKRSKKRKKKLREPVPGELERDEESWSGLQVSAACLGVVAVLFVGWLAWQNVYAAGYAGAGISFFGWLGFKIAGRYLEEND